MKLQHFRNATMLLSLGPHRLLVDPMFAKPGDLPSLKLFGGGGKRNPLVALPASAREQMEEATGVLLTHEHPDHLDVPAIRWIRERGLPVWSSSIDAASLVKKGLDAREIHDGDLELAVEVIPARHGHGVLGWLMGPVSGFYLAHPDEPSVYITGDAVWTETLAEAIERLQPDVIIAPAGSANFGLGKDILFSEDELVELARRAPGQVVFNHLECLDHCPTTRQGLAQRMEREGLAEKVQIPKDGEQLHFSRQHSRAHARPKAQRAIKPGFQKWLTAKFAGT